MPPKAEYADKPCTRCGIRLGEHYITSDGSARTAKHYLGGSVRDGCHQALIDEVKRLREQVDYLTDLVEAPVELPADAQKVITMNPTVGHVYVGGQLKQLKIKQLGGAMGSTHFVVAEDV